MKRIESPKLRTELLNAHHYVCALIHADFPVLALYTDGRQNWMYLWCDIESKSRHRFLLFTVPRKSLDEYLRQHKDLRTLIDEAKPVWLLEELRTPPIKRGEKPRITRHLWNVSGLNEVQEYLPTTDSLFDPDLAPDVDLKEELLPERFDVPITGTWFGGDFAQLFKRYERIYAFFYATRPRFVRTINTTLHRVLRAPWTGGFSRVNLYSRLAEVLPAQHALRVAELSFASPGDVKFEAIPSIGESIQQTVLNYLQHADDIDSAAQVIQRALRSADLNRTNLSALKDGSIPLTLKQRSEVDEAVKAITSMLGVEKEFLTLHQHAPNSVVYAKAVVSFSRQIYKLGLFQQQGMLDFHEPKAN